MPRIRLSGWWLVLLTMALFASVDAQTVSRTINVWPSTTNYLGFVQFSGADDGQIRISSAGGYTLYLNGDLIGADADSSTVEVWDVSFKNRENVIAVVVDHDGSASPFGLFVVIESPQGTNLSSALDRSVPWFWSDAALPNEAGSSWTEVRLSRLDEVELDDTPVVFAPVQTGTFDPTHFTDLADLDLTRAASIAGYGGGMDGSVEGLRLRSLDGLNIAYNSLSDQPRLVDGDVSSAVSFRRGATSLLQSVQTDLGRLITIDRVRVVTQPPSSSSSYEDNSLRGYSILVSKDGVSFTEVAARNQIVDFRETEVSFAAIAARHVRLVVTEFSARDASPQIGELEVFGVGLDQDGTFRSLALDLGTPELKNFSDVTWFGEAGKTGELELRFRSGGDAVTWSQWSAWESDTTFALQVPEPARWLQYEVRMSTRSLTLGPRLDSVAVGFSTGNLPVASAASSITPLQVDIGVDTDFSYVLDVVVDGSSEGVDRIIVLTPYPAELDVASMTGLGAASVDLAATRSTNDSLVIVLDPPLAESTQVSFDFSSRLLSGSHTFRALLAAPGSDNPLLVVAREDAIDTLSTIVQALKLSFPVLSQVAAMPAVVTPNNDGENELTTIGFVLGRVTSAPVSVEIFDLSGRLVRRLPEQLLGAGTYLGGAVDDPSHPGAWNGRNDKGDLVPPGNYVYRIVVDLEPDDESSVGLVGVAY
ncbi:MAG: hypothetical protein HOM68_28145 [Gemmatimonadetes bacterium]|jgi:hypothetical protein|nr:hypothetical protein [Gemmatimonadota bacterium]MBT4610802.1 hypothetical protein [Gemmatimonadota bacterium]MBT5060448.1 hypothetical protein [Gemmatimonadota bacterium]MBT5142406.1 hypothetical protein [Gemmatimonadota bacterium]MBT5588216.1 hypothetical protein [Gemmatimonadota bacterium]